MKRDSQQRRLIILKKATPKKRKFKLRKSKHAIRYPKISMAKFIKKHGFFDIDNDPYIEELIQFLMNDINGTNGRKL